MRASFDDGHYHRQLQRQRRGPGGGARADLAGGAQQRPLQAEHPGAALAARGGGARSQLKPRSL